MSNGTRDLARAMRLRELEEVPNRLTEGWWTRSAGAHKQALADAKEAVAEAGAEREAIEERFGKKRSEIAERYGGLGSDGAAAELKIARRDRDEALGEVAAGVRTRLAELLDKAPEAARAAARHHQVFGTPFAKLRSSRRTAGETDLTETEYEALVGAVREYAATAQSHELLGRIQQLRADGDEVRLYGVVLGLDARHRDDRPITSADLVGLLEMPEADAEASRLESVVAPVEELLELAREFESGGELRTGDGLRHLARAMASKKPAERAVAIEEGVAKLRAAVSTAPESEQEPRHQERIASAMDAAGDPKDAA